MLFRLSITLSYLLAASLGAATLTVTGDSSCQAQLLRQHNSSPETLRYAVTVSAPYQIHSMASVHCLATATVEFFTLPAVTFKPAYLEITRFSDFTSGIPAYSLERFEYNPGEMFAVSLSASYHQSMWFTSGSNSWVSVRAITLAQGSENALPLFEYEPAIAPASQPDSAIPEPSTFWLAGCALVAYLPSRRRKRCPQ